MIVNRAPVSTIHCKLCVGEFSPILSLTNRQEELFCVGVAVGGLVLQIVMFIDDPGWLSPGSGWASFLTL